jgi:hypothetical protein
MCAFNRVSARSVLSSLSPLHVSPCRYKPRLTAASYKFFIRGQNARAAATDYVVAANKKVGNSPRGDALQMPAPAFSSAPASLPPPSPVRLDPRSLAPTYPHMWNGAKAGADSNARALTRTPNPTRRVPWPIMTAC